MRVPENIGPPVRSTETWQGEPTPDPAFDGGGPYSSSNFAPNHDDGYFDDGQGSCNSCGACNNCCRGPIYARGEYLLWWLTGDSTPALVTTSPAGTPRAQAGVLGQPNTSVLFGGKLNSDARSGARVVLGMWLDPNARLEGEWFGLGQNTANFTQTSSGTPILARPFFNLTTGAQDSNVIAFPSQLQGAINVSETSSFMGAGIHATQNMLCGDYCGDRHYRVDFLYGFRYLRLHENLTINDSITANAAATVPANTGFTTTDAFGTSNNFYGLNLGMTAESRIERWCFTSIGRLGLGGTSQNVNISGNSTATTANGQTTSFNGGLLALPTNIGSYNHSGFTVVPQLELKLAYDLTQNFRFTFGYDVIYWSRVVRPGGQIDTFVNTSQASGQPLVGTPGPRFTLHETDLWIQGISAGGELRF